MPEPDATRIAHVVGRLVGLPQETEAAEFKRNYQDPNEIGEYISALANAAALLRTTRAHMIWGVEDETHALVGTTFSPSVAKKGNEPLEAWLLRGLRPQVDFRFHEATVMGKAIVLLEIEPASGQPVAFKGTEYIRVGSSKRRLRDYPAKERALWRSLEHLIFEKEIAVKGITAEEVVSKLDCVAYFDLMKLPVPPDHGRQMERLRSEDLIRNGNDGLYDVTNLGAIVLARDLRDFGRLGRKTLRIVHYQGKGRYHASREHELHAGYAVGFDGMMAYLNGILPASETFHGGVRRTVRMFPEEAVRELVANAFIHQDFSVRGAGPMVEIFDHRIEVTNPGEPLVETVRFIDGAPKSRNESLASLMRRFGLCEERGTGIDKVIFAVESSHLPPPDFRVPPEATQVVLFAGKKPREMDRRERIRAVYHHASLRYVDGDFLTNTSLRRRLGLGDNNRAWVSRIIRDSVQEGVIAPFDRNASPKYMKYVPFWAV